MIWDKRRDHPPRFIQNCRFAHLALYNRAAKKPTNILNSYMDTGYIAQRCHPFPLSESFFMSILHHSQFFTTVNHYQDLPSEPYPEVAFAGRSNAGKSSAINVLCNQKRLAFSSNTPGRTQHINYFTVGRRGETYGYLVDLPGYGYAQTPLSVKEHWNRLLTKYLQERDQLKGLVLMVDIRRGLTELDVQMVQWFVPLARPIHVLLTKCDKLTRNDANKTLFAVRKQLQELAGDWGTVQLFSSTNRVGLEQAGEIIGQWIMQARPESNTTESGRTEPN